MAHADACVCANKLPHIDKEQNGNEMMLSHTNIRNVFQTTASITMVDTNLTTDGGNSDDDDKHFEE